ncbi:hypothetical protein MW887_010013 [Aspergillus wentii]|nr:hypothetical protein MW887_010013 [Aspergillus wentii]
MYFELELRTQQTVNDGKTSPGKTKVKTRGIPDQAELQVETTYETTKAPDLQPTFTVDKRAYKVFSTIFYQSSRISKPGEVPWSEFLHAMSITGFAVEKLYGSVWQFTPSTSDVERSIQFHEPHPGSKMPYRMAKRYGRRLSRAYGWNADLFRVVG